MMRSTLATALVLSLFALAACGGQHPEAAAPAGEASKSAKAAPAGNVKEPGDAKVGDTAKCPVSGEEFTVEASSPKVEHDGKTYFFCCAGCKKKFEADPSKFAKKT